MNVTMFNDEPAPRDGDLIIFREKPSAFLYVSEAARMVAVLVLAHERRAGASSLYIRTAHLFFSW